MPISARASSPPRRIAIASLILFGLLALPLATLRQRANAAPGGSWSRSILSPAQAESLTNPAPLQTETTAGPWRLTVEEVVTGDDAANLVTGASSFNEPPADGFTYVAAKVKATNAGNLPYRIDGNDFAVVGSSGLVRRFVGAIAPDPALDGTAAPGDSLEGWVVGGALADDQSLILLFDSTTLTGNWSDAAFALTDGASLAAVEGRAVEVNKTGRNPDDAAGINTQIVTRNWAVEVLDVVQGEAVANLFPESDYRTTALIGTSQTVTDTWIAFRVRVTNNQTGGLPAYFPETAFTLADSDGNPLPDLSTLSPPDPDAAGAYYPGASRDGWVLFDTVNNYNADVELLRFLPHRTDEDARYFTWGGGTAPASNEPSFSGTLETGTSVETTEDLVRMRDNPSTDGKIVVEMPKGTKLTVTGGPEDGGGLTWYPVKDPDSGDTGYVAQQFIKRVD